MKRIYVFIFLIGFTTFTFAQVEFSNKFKGIPPSNTNPKPEKKYIPPANPNVPLVISPNVYKSPNIIQSVPNAVDDYKIATKTEMSMTPTNELMNPGDEMRDKLNKSISKSLVNEGLKENDSYIRKKDIDFGVIRTTSPYLIIRMRDFGAIDGDLVSITLIKDYKKDVLANNLSLQYDYTDVKANLKNGLNFLEIMAMNRGSAGGNTGAFIILDDKGQVLVDNLWDNIDAGVRSKFRIVKE